MKANNNKITIDGNEYTADSGADDAVDDDTIENGAVEAMAAVDDDEVGSAVTIPYAAVCAKIPP